MEHFNPTRLDLARRRRGLTKSKLAEAAGITPRLLNLYERGEREVTEATAEKLAAVLSFPVAFFEGDDVEEPTLEGVSFRSLSTMTARQRDQATGAAAISLQLDDWIRERFEMPTPDVPRLRGVDPETAAQAVRQAWDMGERKAPNMVHLLEARGARVFSLVQECAEVDAFSFWRDNIPYVFLNNQKTAERSRMDAAHELGHLVMHWHGGTQGRVAEDQAQAFASAFLMPRRSVIADAPKGATVDQIIKAKRRWNVAAMNLTHRMHKLHLLTEWQARSTYIELTRLGYRDGEPGGMERETSQILPKVFVTLRQEGVSRAQVARELAVPVDEISRAAFGLTIARGDARGTTGQMPTQPNGSRPNLRVVV
jgi:Zn-dependent peptidase ImmA (M78 family)/DNA-binding XRE family transcriptional regulator